MKFKPEKKYSGNILLSSQFAEKYIDNLDINSVKVYLNILYLATENIVCSFDEAAKNVHLETDEYLLSLSVLQSQKLIKLKGETITVLDISLDDETFDKVEFYTPEDVVKINNGEFSLVRNAAEKSFSKILSHKDVNRLVEMFNWINIPAEIAVLIIEYAANQGKKSLSYVEKVAIDWSEKGIDTIEKAHNYISVLENVNTLAEKIKRNFMAFDKVLSRKDREYISDWQKNYTEQEIMDALETTVNATEKLRFSYANKVLLNKDKNINPEKTKQVVGIKNKFNNFTQGNTDYSEIEKKAMEKLIAKHGKEV